MSQELTQLPPAHPGHDYVGAHEIEVSLLRLQQPERFCGVVSLQATISEPHHGAHDERTHHRLIFHHQHVLRTSLNRRGYSDLAGMLGDHGDLGPVYPDGGTPAYLGVGPY